jgi:hypothetical protein
MAFPTQFISFSLPSALSPPCFRVSEPSVDDIAPQLIVWSQLNGSLRHPTCRLSSAGAISHSHWDGLGSGLLVKWMWQAVRNGGHMTVHRSLNAVSTILRVSVHGYPLFLLPILLEVVVHLLLDRLAMHSVPGVARIDVRINTLPSAWEVGHNAFVLHQSGAHFIVRDVVEEDALAQGSDGHGGAKFAVAGSQNGGSGFLEEGPVKGRVVHGQTCAGKETQEAGVVLGREEAADVGESCREGHVDGDGVAVAQRGIWDQLVQR